MFPVLQAYQFECEEGKWYTAQGEVEKRAAQGHGFMSSALGLMLSGSLLHLVVQSRICHGFGTSLFHGDSNLHQPGGHMSVHDVFFSSIVGMVDGYLVLVKNVSPHQMHLLRLKLISPICGPLDAPVT